MKSSVIIVIFFFLSLISSYAVNIQKMSNLTAQDGLFSDRIFKTFRDHNGYLWVLGINGVARYDGKDIINFTQQNDPSFRFIQGNRFYSIIQDKHNDIWIGGDDGLNLYDESNSTFTVFPLKDKERPVVRFMEVLNDSSFWVSCTDSSNYVVNSNKHKIYKRDEKYLFTSSDKDTNGNLYLSTRAGHIIKNFNDTVLQLHTQINDICFSSLGQLYIATNNNLMMVEPELLTVDPLVNVSEMEIQAKSWLSKQIIKTVEYVDGIIWAGTSNGLNKCVLDENGSIKKIEDLYAEPNNQWALNNNIINDINCDHEGIIWIASYGGINKIDASRKWFTNFQYDPDDQNSLHDNYIFPICGDHDGNVWMGSHNSGLSKYNIASKSFKYYTKENTAITNNHIRHLYTDSQGVTWIITNGNTCQFINDRILPVTFTNNKHKIHGQVRCIVEHPDGSYWLGCKNCIYKLSKTKEREYKVLDELQFNTGKEAIQLFVDRYERIWMGTYGTLYMLNPLNNRWISFNKNNVLFFQSNAFQTIDEDTKGNIWIGSTHGLYFVKNDSIFKHAPKQIKFNAYFEEDGLLSNNVLGILPGERGEMWFSSWKGIMKYKPLGSDIAKFTYYTLLDGLPNEKFNRYAYYLDTLTHTAYWGNAGGVSYLKLDDLDDEYQEPNRVLLNNIEVDGQVSHCTNDSVPLLISNEGGIKKLQISIACSSLKMPEKQVFAWRMEDENWTYTRNRDIIIENISPGTYALEICALSNQKNLGPIITVDIRITSMLWRISFIALGIILISVLVYYILQKKQGYNKQEKYKGAKLTSDKSSEMIVCLNRLMEEEKPYLNPDLTVNQLADLIGISSGKLSQVLNDYVQTRFYEYVNKYRVEEFVKCLENHEDETMTLIALSEKCGFSSKSSFYRFFKDEKGTTPAQYAKRLK